MRPAFYLPTNYFLDRAQLDVPTPARADLRQRLT
jgi:hypothetical protein